MQPLELTPGDSAGIESVVPASLSEMATVPALKEFEGLAVVCAKLDQVAAPATTTARPHATALASSLRARLIGRSASRSAGPRPRSGPGSPTGRSWGARR